MRGKKAKAVRRYMREHGFDTTTRNYEIKSKVYREIAVPVEMQAKMGLPEVIRIPRITIQADTGRRFYQFAKRIAKHIA